MIPMEQRGPGKKTLRARHCRFLSPRVHSTGERLSLPSVTALLGHNELCCALGTAAVPAGAMPGGVWTHAAWGMARVWPSLRRLPLGGHTGRASDCHWGRAPLQQAQIPHAKRLLKISDI